MSHERAEGVVLHRETWGFHCGFPLVPHRRDQRDLTEIEGTGADVTLPGPVADNPIRSMST